MAKKKENQAPSPEDLALGGLFAGLEETQEELQKESQKEVKEASKERLLKKTARQMNSLAKRWNLMRLSLAKAPQRQPRPK